MAHPSRTRPQSAYSRPGSTTSTSTPRSTNSSKSKANQEEIVIPPPIIPRLWENIFSHDTPEPGNYSNDSEETRIVKSGSEDEGINYKKWDRHFPPPEDGETESINLPYSVYKTHLARYPKTELIDLLDHNMKYIRSYHARVPESFSEVMGIVINSPDHYKVQYRGPKPMADIHGRRHFPSFDIYRRDDGTFVKHYELLESAVTALQDFPGGSANYEIKYVSPKEKRAERDIRLIKSSPIRHFWIVYDSEERELARYKSSVKAHNVAYLGGYPKPKEIKL